MKKSKRIKGKALLLVHDVAPPHAREIMAILSDLRELRIPALNLAVISCFHHRYPWPDESPLREAIQSLSAQCRLEIMLHGYYHHRIGSNEFLPWRSRLRSRLQSAAEDEFFKLDSAAAAARIESGSLFRV